jgi:carbon storage regulator CsrA
MLVLSRKEGERIVIGDQITLVVSKVSGNRVTIGIEAPKDVKITRGELLIELADDPLSVDQSSGSAARPRRVASQTVKPKGSLREFAASVLPLQRQVG